MCVCAETQGGAKKFLYKQAFQNVLIFDWVIRSWLSWELFSTICVSLCVCTPPLHIHNKSFNSWLISQHAMYLQKLSVLKQRESNLGSRPLYTSVPSKYLIRMKMNKWSWAINFFIFFPFIFFFVDWTLLFNIFEERHFLNACLCLNLNAKKLTYHFLIKFKTCTSYS